jgi:hypothetical protein
MVTIIHFMPIQPSVRKWISKVLIVDVLIKVRFYTVCVHIISQLYKFSAPLVDLILSISSRLKHVSPRRSFQEVCMFMIC